MTKSVTKIQDKDTNKRLSVVRSTADPTKYGVVILNPDGSKISGPKGDKGDAATISVGSTCTGAPGTSACVVNSGTTSDAVLDFTIPRGDKGETGTAATVSVGTTSTLDAGCCATVSNSGTSSAAVFNFGIPKGDKGDQGVQGPAATIEIGTTCTGNPGTEASVTNSGTSEAAVFNFTIPQGVKGDTGNAATISVGTTTTLNPGCNACVNNSGTSGAAVFNFGIPKGAKGDTGTAATVSVGTTSTLSPSCSATVTNSGTSSAAVFNFGIPKGDKGDTGSAATVSVGTTTTLCDGCSATVTNSGTSSAAVFNFGIPKGAKGDQGCQGETGPAGNGICCVTCEKVGKETTVTIYETDGSCCAFTVCDGNDGEGSGDVLGPSVSVNNNVVLFDGTSGKLIKDSGKALPNVINCLCSTSTTDALSAAQGKALNDRIEDLMALGKFLSLWDSETGLPISFPQATPYSYSTGDYFLVENVGTTNYKPNGSSYTGAASTTVETDEVDVGDIYIYDGVTWLLQINHGKTVSFANLSGVPEDNACLCAALDSKANTSSLCAVATSGKYCDLTGQPTKLSCFTNDCGYTTCTGTLTASNISDTAYGSSWDGVSTVAPSKNAVYDKIQSVVSSIPTNNNQLSNGCGYTTCTGTLVASDLTPYAKCTDIPTDNCQLANGCGYITGITCANVTTALGYTPYNSTNPNGYTTCTGTLTSSDIADLAQCCDIPTDNCQLSNGCGYITSSSLPGSASSTVAGIIKLGSDTVQSCAAEGVSCVANRTYAVQVNSSGQALVNVPWCNTQCVTSVNGCTGAVTTVVPSDLNSYVKCSASCVQTITTTASGEVTPLVVTSNSPSASLIRFDTCNGPSGYIGADAYGQPIWNNGAWHTVSLTDNLKTVNGNSIVGTGNISLSSLDEMTQAEYNALPSSKETDGIWRLIYE